MEELKIEKGIPFVGHRTSGLSSLLRRMEAGDSVFLDSGINVRSTRANLGKYGKKLGKKFVIRKVTGGHRLWCIE